MTSELKLELIKRASLKKIWGLGHGMWAVTAEKQARKWVCLVQKGQGERDGRHAGGARASSPGPCRPQ